MKRNTLSVGALLCGSALASPAFAQTFQSAPPPLYNNVDSLGIDLTQGVPNINFTEGSIGPSDGGIAYTRTWVAGAGWTDNWTGGAFTKTSGGVTTAYVEHGGLTEIFTQSGSNWVNNQGTGSTLSGNSPFTYTAADGTVTTYSDYNVDTTGYIENLASCSGDQGTCRLPSKITRPNGVTYTYSWTVADRCPNGNAGLNCGGRTYYRLASILSSTGFKITITYAGNTVTGSAPPPAWFTKTGMTFTNNLVTCGTSCSSVTYPTSSDYLVVDALGREWQFSSSTMSRIRRPSSSSDNVTFAYDSNGHVSSVFLLGIGTWTYHFVDSGTTRTATVTDPLGHVTTVISDLTLGRPTLVTDALSRSVAYDYDANGRKTYETDYTISKANYNKKIQFGYDARGNLNQVTTYPKYGSPLANIVISSVYPTTCTNPVTCNQPTSTTDANSHTTSYTYDPTHGGVLTVTQPAVGGIQPQTRYSYSKLDNTGAVTTATTGMYKLTGTSACRTTASCVGTADETKTSIGWGNNLLPKSVSTGAGDGSLTATKGYAFDAAGNPYTFTNTLSNVTRYRYDADREMVGIVGPDPDGSGVLKNRAQRYTFSPDGLVTLVEQGTVPSQSDADWPSFTTLQQVATAYDSGDRKVEDSAQAGGTTYAAVQYSYDAANRLQCTAQRMNSSTFSALPASACTLATAGSYGPDRVIFNSYDNADELTQVTSGYGVSGLQRNEETYTYSVTGKVKTLADAKNNLTTYVYDDFDRLSQTQYPSPTTAGTSNTADYEQLGYDPAGNVTSRRLRDGTSIGYGYDALNRMSSKTLPSPEHGVTYAYDNFGHPTTITGATTLSYVFDALGRMTSETQAYGSVSYLYDLANRRTRLTWQDGTYLTYDYDAADEMAHIYENGTTALVSFNYDDLGQRTKRTLATGSITTYGYDPVSRLTSLTMTGGTNPNTTTLSNYSPAGEIGSHANSNDAYAWTQGYNLNRAYTVNGLNQFATIAGATQGYDGRGNLTSSGGITYAYTSENLLKTVSGGFTLAYDPIGRLQEYDVPTATRFVYDGGMISEELNSSGTVLRRYVSGPAGDEPIVWYEGSGTTTRRYMDQDERGSITRITNQDGSILAINSYDEYGIPASTNQGRFGYTGQAWLSEIGLAYYKARFYSPTLGRFLQTDPIGYADGPNWYNYVAGDPINLIDPTGTCEYVWKGFSDGHYEYIGTSGADCGRSNTGGSGNPSGIGSGSPEPSGGGSGGNTSELPQNDMDAAASDVDCSSCMSGDNEIVVTANKSMQPFALAIGTASPELLAEEGGGGIFAAIGRFFGRVFGRTACFAAGTLVQTGHGLRPIETIKPGDLVLSRDGKTGATAYRRVTAVKVPTQDELYDVDLDVPEGAGAEHHADFRATATHPWRNADGRWVPTLQLRRGMQLVRFDGSPARVEAVHDTGNKAPTYNLTVEGSHTYFVGKDHLWVHNACNFGGTKSAQKWANQMVQRGWTEAQIEEAIANGESFPATNNINPGNGATRYVNPTTGRSVVVDNSTGAVIHVGGDGFVY